MPMPIRRLLKIINKIGNSRPSYDHIGLSASPSQQYAAAGGLKFNKGITMVKCLGIKQVVVGSVRHAYPSAVSPGDTAVGDADAIEFEIASKPKEAYKKPK